MPITHTKVSAIADDPAASAAGEVLPSDWNADHTFSLTKTDVGLGNVDNTSDEAKPVSTATQTALDLKAPLSSPDFTGDVNIAGGTVTVSTPVINATQTWNAAGVSFTGWKLNITVTASNNTGKFLDFQRAGVSKFNVDEFGQCNADSFGSGTWFYAIASGTFLRSSGVFGFTTGNANASADTGQARKAAKVHEFNSGTAGTYTGTAWGSGSQTVAQLPVASTAGKGARSFVTDASTTLVLGLGTTVAGGGANNVPVYSDGTNWLYG